MLFGQMLVKVSDREVRVKFALEPAQLAERLRRYALAPRPPTPLIHHCRYPLVLDRAADPPHRGVIAKISAAATHLSCPSIALVITSRRVIALTSRATCRSMLPIARL
jgi:hypothetical protein